MFNKVHRQAGMTLVELIVAIVIISVGLAGVLSVFSSTARNSADPMVQKQLLAIAEGMMEEVMLLPYAIGSGTDTGCARAGFDDIHDFASYSNQPICDPEGVSIASLSGYSVSVAIDDIALDGVTDARRITVTAQRNANEVISLVGWRTNWAPP